MLIASTVCVAVAGALPPLFGAVLILTDAMAPAVMVTGFTFAVFPPKVAVMVPVVVVFVAVAANGETVPCIRTLLVYNAVDVHAATWSPM